ncbi:MAG: EAL domain-containing protein [Rhodopseudomonas palustris]|uniref:EAL domain-containing protein n=1 Tax=Rhodopseudomonas palustris TaxID=1076 RepID=A0A933RT82_RHOPL|nr:EAL domain-containing protein [Rhodopseudomonas palustris]
MKTAESNFKATILAKAQASAALQNLNLTLISNVAIAASLAFLLHQDGKGTAAAWWLTATVALAVLRWAWVSHLLAARIDQHDPLRLLRHLTWFALAGGLLWSAVPLGFDAFTKESVDYVIFIMVGVTTGAIIQSVAYPRIGFAFGAPVMFSTLIGIVSSGKSTAFIISLDGLFLTFMLFRAAVMGERSFIASQITAFEATNLAESLAQANVEVLNTNRALERLARADPLTGLANRSHFREVAAAACSSRRGVAFVLFDIDRFKTINDTRGHDTGDRVIGAVADVLQSVCGPGDLPVRLGGDEFIVVVQGDDVAERARALAERFAEAVKTPLEAAGHPLQLSCSIGIAAHSGGPIDVEELFARADAALYRAKDDGRACTRVFDARMHDEFVLQRRIDSDLPRALALGRLHVEFQPQVVMATREVIGFEALLRWRHPIAGMIPPPEIVSAAIRLQLSAQLLSFVAEQVCDFLLALDGAGAPPVRVAVNVSPRELSMHSPAEILKEATLRAGVDPRRIEIEITEDALFDPKQCARELQQIDQYGFALAIDDFGVGHSSIANLMTIELDTIKIDRSFVHDIASNRQNQQLVAAITAVARPLGHGIIAEGVESEEEAEVLRLLGCSCGQGWLYGRPMQESDAIAWLTGERGGVDLRTAALRA